MILLPTFLIHSTSIFTGNCSSKNNQELKIILLAQEIEKILSETKFYEIERELTEEKLKKIFCPQIKQLEKYCDIFGDSCKEAEKIIHFQLRQIRKIGHIRNLKKSLQKIIKKEIHGKIS